MASKDQNNEADERPEPLQGVALHGRFPKLRLRGEPRVMQGSLGFGTHGLFELFDCEATLDAYPTSWLRFGLVYSVGLSFEWDGNAVAGKFAQYGEAVAGLRLFGRASEADTDLQLRRSIGNYGEALPSWARPSRGDYADVVPVLLPSSHQLFVEGGALTGFMGLKACTAHCELEPTEEPTYRPLSRQLLIPFAGIRYVYYSEALMDQPRVNRIRYGQVFAHVLLHAFNQPAGAAFYLSGDRVERSEVGGRFGVDLPLSPFCVNSLLGGGCAQLSSSIGYTPFPAFLLFDAHVRFPIR